MHGPPGLTSTRAKKFALLTSKNTNRREPAGGATQFNGAVAIFVSSTPYSVLPTERVSVLNTEYYHAINFVFYTEYAKIALVRSNGDGNRNEQTLTVGSCRDGLENRRYRLLRTP